jgi:hypothetical protein
MSDETESSTQSKLETRFQKAGTLPRPGPIGRLVRLLWGILLAYAVYDLLTHRGGFVRESMPYWTVWIYVPLLLAVFPYVVNIGFGLNWRAWPRRIVIAILAVGMLFSRLATGDVWWTPELGWFVYLWFLYFCTHLGSSFLVAAVIATPGCEMRALPHLWTLVTGNPTSEHYCPGMMNKVDGWERSRADRA